MVDSALQSPTKQTRQKVRCLVDVTFQDRSGPYEQAWCGLQLA
jgi:hypothetical protein